MQLISDFAHNFRLLFRAFTPDDVRVTPAQVILATLAGVMVMSISDAMQAWWPTGFSPSGFAMLMGVQFLSIVASILAAVIVGRLGNIGSLFVMSAPIYLVLLAFLVFSFGTSELIDPVNMIGALVMTLAPWAIFLVLYLVWLARSLDATPGWKYARATVVVVAVSAVSVTFGGMGPRAFYSYDASGYGDTTAARIDPGAVHSAQYELRRQWDTIPHGRPGEAEVFGLVLGGTAHQSVFASEVKRSSEILGRAYDAQGRIYHLLNDDDRPDAHPLASAENLSRALEHMAGRMNAGEDWAILYLSSHGGPDMFSLSFWQVGLRGISAQELATMIEAAGLRNVVVVLSACYAGSFVDDLAAPDRIIIAAAAEDKTSFGCADGRDWTYFGEAFWAHGVESASDPRAAFALAKVTVGRWEEEQGLTPSDPQIDIGTDIAERLDSWTLALSREEAALTPR